jgi:hypothetical protein
MNFFAALCAVLSLWLGSVAKIDFNQKLPSKNGGKPRFLKGGNAYFSVFATEPLRSRLDIGYDRAALCGPGWRPVFGYPR